MAHVRERLSIAANGQRRFHLASLGLPEQATLMASRTGLPMEGSDSDDWLGDPHTGKPHRYQEFDVANGELVNHGIALVARHEAVADAHGFFVHEDGAIHFGSGPDLWRCRLGRSPQREAGSDNGR